jgi:hypothetical protein
MKKESVEENPGTEFIQIIKTTEPFFCSTVYVTLVGGMEPRHVIKTSRSFFLSIPASSDKVEYNGRQKKQCSIKYI